MSITSTGSVPLDIRESLDRLSHFAGLAPDDVLREALELFARDLEDRQAAEQIAPRKAGLQAILARNPRPSRWQDSDELLY
jgi:predicted DNA-binding protein